MSCEYYTLLTRKHELEESRLLYSSYTSGIKEFTDCFYNLYSVDYKDVFGNQPVFRVLFELLKKYYRNDFFIRHSFMKKVLFPSNAVSFQELPISDSRVDLASVNGKSVAFEIKTNYDNYSRLLKQVEDYSKCFEYVYVICSFENFSKMNKLLPSFCGVYVYSGKNSVSFKKIKNAVLSPNLNSIAMLNLFKKSELKACFKETDIELISNECPIDKINKCLKRVLKKRFSYSWEKAKQELSIL